MCSSPRPQYPLFPRVKFLCISFFFESYHQLIVPFSPNGETLTFLYFLASFFVFPLAFILFLIFQIRLKFNEATDEITVYIKPFTISEMLRIVLPVIIGIPLVTEITFCPEHYPFSDRYKSNNEMNREERWILAHYEELIKKGMKILKL